MEKWLNEIASSEINKKLLRGFLIHRREMSDEVAVDRYVNEMSKRGIFYIPKQHFLEDTYGIRIRKALEEYYPLEKELQSKTLYIPVETLNGSILGFIMNNPYSGVKYKYPDKLEVSKGRYFQMSKNNFLKSLELDYIIICEGVFDEIAISSIDCVGCCVNGSTITKDTAKILNLPKNKIIISDNDTAGKKLYQMCKEYFTGNIVSIKIPTKDIDQFLRVEKNQNDFKAIVDRELKSSWALHLIKIGC